MSNYNITLADLSDIEIVAQMFDLYRQFYQQQPDIELATDFISTRMKNKESIIFIVRNGVGKSMGFCQLYPSFCSVEAIRIYVLYDLFVLPEYRRSGVARKLLKMSEEHAKLNHIGRMDLSTAKNNMAAQALYESLGWVRDDIFFAYSWYDNG